MFKVQRARLSVVSEVEPLHLQVMRPITDDRKAIMPVSEQIRNAVEITSNGYKTNV